MSLRHRLPSALATLAGMLAASAASAQTIVLPTGAQATEWADGYVHEIKDETKINQRDCIENPTITFNLDYTGNDLSGFGVEAWIGSDCTNVVNRRGNPAACTRVDKRDLANPVMHIPVRTLVGPLDGTDTDSTAGTGGTGGTAGTGGTGGTGAASGMGGSGGEFTAGGGGTAGLGAAGGSGGAGSGGTATDAGTGGSAGSATEAAASVCQGDESKSTPSTRTLWFMVLNDDLDSPPGVTSGWSAKWAYTYDLVGPQAPTGVTAGIGENALVVKWSEAEDADSDIDEYWFLCEPPPGDMGAAGATGDGGSDPLDPGECESTVFQEGDLLDRSVIAEHACGHAPATASSGETSALTNFVHYTVAVVGRDDYKNYGKLSSIACSTPEPVTDFFEAYRDAGGKGGGGFCSIGTERTHALTALVLAGALGFFVRRARRRAERKDAS
jgi:hypothetical protein